MAARRTRKAQVLLAERSLTLGILALVILATALTAAFALACTALEEIGRSQYAADVYTGFVPPDGFTKIIRQHEFKSAYISRFVQFGPLIQPFLKDGQHAGASPHGTPSR